MADDIALASGGVAAAREKTYNGVTKKFQQTTTVAGDTLATSTVAVDATTPVQVNANASRVYLQIRPLDGDLRLAGSSGAVANSSLPYTYRTIKLGEIWETAYYAGAVFIRAETGTVTVEIEQVS